MKAPTWTYLPLLFVSLAAPAGLARAGAEAAPAPALDVVGVSRALFTFDVLVAGAEQAAQASAEASRQLAYNGLHVAERPAGLSSAQAQAVWRAVTALPPEEKRDGLALLRRSDVVTTEAHALLLQMLGPPPTFSPRPAPTGLSERQLAWVRLAPALSALMQQIYRDAHVEALFASLRGQVMALQPTAAELAADVRLLDGAFGRSARPEEQVQLIVVPLMAQDTGATLMLGGRGAITLVGPVVDAHRRQTLVVHEMLHPRLASLMAEHPALLATIEASSCLREAAKHAAGDRAVSQVYDVWRDYFVESWVRGLARELTHGGAIDAGFALAGPLGKVPGGGGADALAERAEHTLQQLAAHLCLNAADQG